MSDTVIVLSLIFSGIVIFFTGYNVGRLRSMWKYKLKLDELNRMLDEIRRR